MISHDFVFQQYSQGPSKSRWKPRASHRFSNFLSGLRMLMDGESCWIPLMYCHISCAKMCCYCCVCFLKLSLIHYIRSHHQDGWAGQKYCVSFSTRTSFCIKYDKGLLFMCGTGGLGFVSLLCPAFGLYDIVVWTFSR